MQDTGPRKLHFSIWNILLDVDDVCHNSHDEVDDHDGVGDCDGADAKK